MLTSESDVLRTVPEGPAAAAARLLLPAVRRLEPPPASFYHQTRRLMASDGCYGDRSGLFLQLRTLKKKPTKHSLSRLQMFVSVSTLLHVCFDWPVWPTGLFWTRGSSLQALLSGLVTSWWGGGDEDEGNIFQAPERSRDLRNSRFSSRQLEVWNRQPWAHASKLGPVAPAGSRVSRRLLKESDECCSTCSVAAAPRSGLASLKTRSLPDAEGVDGS